MTAAEEVGEYVRAALDDIENDRRLLDNARSWACHLEYALHLTHEAVVGALAVFESMGLSCQCVEIIGSDPCEVCRLAEFLDQAVQR